MLGKYRHAERAFRRGADGLPHGRLTRDLRRIRAPVDHIPAPAFPARLPWINVAALRMDQQRGRPVLVEFWDFCRPNSLRTLPYVKAWHERYAELGLRVIGVHSAGFEPSEDPDAVAAAVERLGVEYPVVVDVDHQIWQEYENVGWPARYLWTGDSSCSTTTTARAPTPRPSWRSRSCWASSATPSRRSAPRTSRAPCWCHRARTCPAPTAAPTRPAASGACSTGAASRPSTASGSRFRTPAPTS